MKSTIKLLFSRRTRAALRFDHLRLVARIKTQWRGRQTPTHPRLHFGCGRRWVAGWLNVDVTGSQCDIDLAAQLPWHDDAFECVVSQQVIEHLEIESEIMPLFSELRRVIKPSGELWLSCPDLAKVCHAYIENRGRGLLEDRRTRMTVPWREGMPYSQMINVLFHQGNEHKNLYDFELLKWLMESNGFHHVQRVDEAALLQRFPEFPRRNDDRHTLYVRAERASVRNASSAAAPAQHGRIATVTHGLLTANRCGA